MNPFHPFQPALGQKFFNRSGELNSILQRINQSASTAVVGNPHIGKTSLIKKLADPKQLKAANIIASQNAIAELTIELFDEKDTPAKFWQEVCKKAITHKSDFVKPLKVFTNHAKYNSHALFDTFGKIGAKGKRVIVFIDEFDKILNRPHLKSIDFIEPLQAMTQKTGGLCLVITSRKSIADLQEEIPVFGSPFDSNAFHLGGFDDATIDELFLESGLSADGIEEAKLLGGHHPFLLHLAGELLWEVRDKPAAQWCPTRSFH